MNQDLLMGWFLDEQKRIEAEEKIRDGILSAKVMEEAKRQIPPMFHEYLFPFEDHVIFKFNGLKAEIFVSGSHPNGDVALQFDIYYMGYEFTRYSFFSLAEAKYNIDTEKIR